MHIRVVELPAEQSGGQLNMSSVMTCVLDCFWMCFQYIPGTFPSPCGGATYGPLAHDGILCEESAGQGCKQRSTSRKKAAAQTSAMWQLPPPVGKCSTGHDAQCRVTKGFQGTAAPVTAKQSTISSIFLLDHPYEHYTSTDTFNADQTDFLNLHFKCNESAQFSIIHYLCIHIS